MNEQLTSSIGSFISVSVKFIVDGLLKVEHIQGKLVEVDGNIFIVEQYVPLCNFFSKEDFNTFRRAINIENLEGKINNL